MVLRNVTRSAMTAKGLRIWRKKHVGKRLLTVNQLWYLFIMSHANRGYSISYWCVVLERQCIWARSSQVVGKNMRRLTELGFIAKDVKGQYCITGAGKAALYEIERCIRDARPDR